MALTVDQSMAHARSFLKVGTSYASAEEVRFANSVQSAISSFHRWHWNAAAASNISLTQSTQDYTMVSGDQNTVLAVQNAYLTDASNTYPELLNNGDKTLPVTAIEDRPIAVCLISPTQIRLWPNPNATYTFIWRKHKYPVVITANSESFDIPDAFTDVAKQGMIGQLLTFADDDRSGEETKKFFALLAEQKRRERMTMGRIR